MGAIDKLQMAMLPDAAGALPVSVSGVRAGLAFEAHDWVAEEVPVALEYNGISHAVMLATPRDLEDFALGFSLSEGILGDHRELYSIEEESSPEGITLRLQIANSAQARLKDRRRSLAGRTGCGLCGTESLQHVRRQLPVCLPIGSDSPRFGREAIAHAMSQFRGLQVLQQSTGAVHAAAWCSARGDVMWLREDVGRHNALDKLIGALVKNGVDASAGFIAITSRASFEMVQKAAIAGVSLLAAVSAPTSLAVTTAESARMTLVGFARGRDLVVYCHPQGLAMQDDIRNRHAAH
jgi:FdhD protein